MKSFDLPDLGEGLPHAIVRQWHAQPGDMIEQDATLVTVETAKSLVDLPMPCDGVIQSCCYTVDETVPTGSALCHYQPTHAEDTNLGTPTQPSPTTPAPSQPIQPHPPQPIPTMTKRHHATDNSSDPAPKIVPRARQLAKQHHLPIAWLAQFAPDEGPITIAIVEDILASFQIQPLKPWQNEMAAQVTHALNQVVPTTLCDDVDLGDGPKVHGLMLHALQALVRTCQKYPTFASHYHPNIGFLIPKSLRVSIAVHSQHGLFTPSIDAATILDNPQCLAELATMKAAADDLSFPNHLQQPGHILLSNVGSIAGKYATPLLQTPSVATLAMGRCYPQWVGEGTPSRHLFLPVSLSFDHRVLSGGQAAEFLKDWMAEIQTKI